MKKKQPTSVVTGAAGFLGSHLTDLLLARGHKVIGIASFDVTATSSSAYNSAISFNTNKPDALKSVGALSGSNYLQLPNGSNLLWSTFKNSAKVEVVYLTGGPVRLGDQSLYEVFSAVATEQASGRDIPPQQITVTDFGETLAADRTAYKVLPNPPKVRETLAADVPWRDINQLGARYRPIISFGGTNVTDRTSSVIVGQKINLTCTLADMDGNPPPASYTITNYVWTVPGITFSNYEPNLNFSKLDKEFLLTTNLVGFYWADKGSPTVTCTVQASGQTLAAQAAFDVNRPTWVFTSATTSDNPPVNVGDFGDNTGPRLHFGTQINFPNSVGIRWIPTITTPSNSEGYFALIQLANSHMEFIYTNNAVTNLSTHGQFWLDDRLGVFYGGGYKHIAANTTASLPASVMQDSPQSPVLVPEWNTVEVANNSFQTYLVFKPVGDNSAWVALSKLEWHWGGTAIQTTNGTWQLNGSGTNAASNPSGVNWVSQPEWTNGTSAIQPE